MHSFSTLRCSTTTLCALSNPSFQPFPLIFLCSELCLDTLIGQKVKVPQSQLSFARVKKHARHRYLHCRVGRRRREGTDTEHRPPHLLPCVMREAARSPLLSAPPLLIRRLSPFLSLIASPLCMEIFGRAKRRAKATQLPFSHLLLFCVGELRDEMTHFGHSTQLHFLSGEAISDSERIALLALLRNGVRRRAALFSEFGWGCCVQNYT